MTKTTAIVPRSITEIATPPMFTVSFGNGLGKKRTSAVQIQAARPLKTSTRPIVMITIVSRLPPSTGRMTTRWMPRPRAKAKTSVAA